MLIKKWKVININFVHDRYYFNFNYMFGRKLIENEFVKSVSCLSHFVPFQVKVNLIGRFV